MKGVTLHEVMIVSLCVTLWHLIFHCNMALRRLQRPPMHTCDDSAYHPRP